MTSGYFEDFEVGASRKAGPYLVSKAEIIQFAKQYDPQPRHIDGGCGAFNFCGIVRIERPHVLDLRLQVSASTQCRRGHGLG